MLILFSVCLLIDAAFFVWLGVTIWVEPRWDKTDPSDYQMAVLMWIIAIFILALMVKLWVSPEAPPVIPYCPRPI